VLEGFAVIIVKSESKNQKKTVVRFISYTSGLGGGKPESEKGATFTNKKAYIGSDRRRRSDRVSIQSASSMRMATHLTLVASLLAHMFSAVVPGAKKVNKRANQGWSKPGTEGGN